MYVAVWEDLNRVWAFFTKEELFDYIKDEGVDPTHLHLLGPEIGIKHTYEVYTIGNDGNPALLGTSNNNKDAAVDIMWDAAEEEMSQLPFIVYRQPLANSLTLRYGNKFHAHYWIEDILSIDHPKLLFK